MSVCVCMTEMRREDEKMVDEVEVNAPTNDKDKEFGIEIADAPSSTFRADLRQHFRFPVSRNDEGTKTQNSLQTLPDDGHTHNKPFGIPPPPPRKAPISTCEEKALAKEASGAQLRHNSWEAEEITRCIGQSTGQAKGSRSFSVPNNDGF